MGDLNINLGVGESISKDRLLSCIIILITLATPFIACAEETSNHLEFATWPPKGMPAPTSKNASTSVQERGMPDLAIEDLSWSPDSPKTGDKVITMIKIENKGNSSAGKDFAVRLYLDSNPVGTKYCDDLNAGMSEIAMFEWTVGREVRGGEHTFFAYVDKDKSGSNNYILESDESNNERSAKFHIIQLEPDLKIESTAWTPRDIKTGDLVKFAVKYTNQGNYSTGKKPIIYVYIDNILIGKRDVGELSPGESELLDLTWTIDRDVKGGTHIVYVYIDKDREGNYNSILESDETNNQISDILPITKINYYTDLKVTVIDKGNLKPIGSAKVIVDGKPKGYVDSEGKVIANVTQGEEHTIEANAPNYDANKIKTKVSYDPIIPVSSNIYLEYNLVPVTIHVTTESGEPLSNAEISVDGGISGTTDLKGEFSFEAKRNTDILVTIAKTGYYKKEPVRISIGRYSTSNSMKLEKELIPPPEMNFESTNCEAVVGQKVVYTLGVLNPVGGKEVLVQMVIKSSPGISIDEAYFTKSGGGLYDRTDSLEPGSDTKHIALGVIGNEVGNHNISAMVYYYYPEAAAAKTLMLNKSLTLKVKDKDLPPSQSPSPTPSSWKLPGFEALALILAFVVVGAYVLRKTQKK